jgi:hypothetical protein
MAATATGRCRNVTEATAGPVSLGGALGKMAAYTVPRAAFGVIEGRRTCQPHRPGAQVAVRAKGRRRAVAEAGAAPVALNFAGKQVTAFAVPQASDSVIEAGLPDRSRRPGASMASAACCRGWCMAEEAVVPPDARAVVTAGAVTRATGSVREALHDARWPLRGVAFRATGEGRFMHEGSCCPGNAGTSGVARHAVADAGKCMGHSITHKARGTCSGMTIQACSGGRAVAECAEDAPAGGTGGVALAAILTAAVHEGRGGERINHRRGSIRAMTIETANAGKRRVIGNTLFCHFRNRLRRRRTGAAAYYEGENGQQPDTSGPAYRPTRRCHGVHRDSTATMRESFASAARSLAVR